MRMQSILPALIVGLALAGLVGVSPADTVKVDTAKIDKLVEQLGSDTFAEREEATAALAKIGMPALGALRKAITGQDSEVRKRAKDLLTKLEKETISAEVLTPKQVHLVYKDTPLKDALEDLKKKTGAQIVLHDPANKLKDTKVTLDTGKTTFWDALDKFCDAAGVVEGDPNTLGAPGVVPGRPIAVPLPGVKVLPAPAQPVAPVKVPAKAIDKPAVDGCGDDAAKASEEKAAEAKKAAEQKQRALALAQEAAKAKAKEAAKAQPIGGNIAIQIQIGGGIAVPVMPIGGIVLPGRAWMPVQPGQITLVPGKRAKVPTDVSSSIRVRLGDKTKLPVLPNPKEINLVLEVSPEPRLRWQSLIGVSIDKAIDDNGTKLKQVVAKVDPNAAPGQVGVVILGAGGPGPMWIQGNAAGMHHYIAVKLEKSAQAAKSLTELTGTIAAYVQTSAEAMMTVENLAKAKGKIAKGKMGTGEIEISSYTKAADGTVTIEFTFSQPENVSPETQLATPLAMPAMPPMIAPPGGGIRIPRIIVPGGAAPGGAGAAPAVPAPGVARAVPLRAVPMMNYAPYGLTLRDDKDNILPATIHVDHRKGRGFGAPGTKMEFVATYVPAKGAAVEPAKLVFTARKTVAIDIPFTLKKIAIE